MDPMEDMDADVLQFLYRLTMAKNNLVQHNGYLPRQCVFGSAPRFPGHVLDEDTDLLLQKLEGRLRNQAEYRRKCRTAAIAVEANAMTRTCLIGRSVPKGDYVLGDTQCTIGEQVKEYITLKDRGRDLRESSVDLSQSNGDQVCNSTCSDGIPS